MDSLDALAHLAAIVESSDDAIISKSLDGTILSWNKAAERIFGYGPADIVGKSILVLIPPDRQDEERQIIARLRGGQRIEHFNTVRLARDGTPLEVLVSISPIKDAAGRIVGASKILRTLTAQRQAERAVANSEARLRGVVDTAVDGIITISDRGIIESINQSVVRTFGYGGDELLGQNVNMLMPEPYLSEHDGYLANYRDGGVRKIIGINRELVGRRKDGSTFPVELAVSEVALADRRIFTGIVRDITHRKVSERALIEAKEAAEAASRAKENFLSVLSHELRTPLSPVLVELGSIEEMTEIPEEIRSRLKMIRRNVETEARLVDDLLDLTRIGRGKVQLKYEVLDLHETVAAAVGMFRSAVDAKKIGLSTDLRADPRHVWADPGRMQQILLNLLSNAVKFTPVGGRIMIGTGNDADGRITVEVSDTGAGIEPEMLGKLFGAFEQSDRTRRLGGLGLGLSIAKSLVDLHGGELTAVSDGRDKGATFRLRMSTIAADVGRHTPAAGRPPEAAETARTVPAGHRVLLVEDHEDTRTVMARLLKSLGCKVTVAACVAEAIAAADSGTFDLLVSDIGLPDGSGLDVMRHMKALVPRAIALSGYGQEDDLRRSREAGFALHLVKPVNFNTLREMLRPTG